MKRLLAVFLTLAILLTGLTITASAASPWKKDGGVWTYTKSNGKLAEDEWILDGGRWYYFEGTGMLVNIARKIGGTWYAFGRDGAMAAGEWIRCRWDPEDNEYLEWYYANADGSLAKGWQNIGGAWYCFYGGEPDETGWDPFMFNGQIREIGGALYAFRPSGEMIGDGWGQVSRNGEKYWVYADRSGVLATGWKQINGAWYYFREDDGVMLEDYIGRADEKDPAVYCFTGSGAMAENSWYSREVTWEDDEGNTGKETAWFYFGPGGAMRKGWLLQGGSWYYLDPEWGIMYYDCMLQMSDNRTYAFGKSGAMVTGWYRSGGSWYYFDRDGARVEKEWVQDGGAWYYMKDGGEMATDETLIIGKKEYCFGKDGAWTGK